MAWTIPRELFCVLVSVICLVGLVEDWHLVHPEASSPVLSVRNFAKCLVLQYYKKPITFNMTMIDITIQTCLLNKVIAGIVNLFSWFLTWAMMDRWKTFVKYNWNLTCHKGTNTNRTESMWKYYVLYKNKKQVIITT